MRLGYFPSRVARNAGTQVCHLYIYHISGANLRSAHTIRKVAPFENRSSKSFEFFRFWITGFRIPIVNQIKSKPIVLLYTCYPANGLLASPLPTDAVLTNFIFQMLTGGKKLTNFTVRKKGEPGTGASCFAQVEALKLKCNKTG